MDWQVRELQESDIKDDFFETLENISNRVKKDKDEGLIIYSEMSSNPNHRIFAAIGEDGKVLGLATLLVERKFIHDFGLFGHIEDVVVRRDYERKGIGGSLVRKATEAAKEIGCYEVRLCCSNVDKGFYEKQGYRRDGNSMIMKFGKSKK